VKKENRFLKFIRGWLPLYPVKMPVYMYGSRRKRTFMSISELFLVLFSLVLIYFGLTTPLPEYGSPNYSEVGLWTGLAKVLGIIGIVAASVLILSYGISFKYEDSYPLQGYPRKDYFRQRKRYIEQNVRGFVLDLETRDGLAAIEAASKDDVMKVVATDLDEKNLEKARKNAIDKGVADKIEFRIGDLFQSVKQNESFDHIILNAPYVASRTRKVVEQSLREAKNHLNPEGTILVMIPRLDEDIITEYAKDYVVKVLWEDPLIVENFIYLSLRKKQQAYEDKTFLRPELQPSETTSISTEAELMQPHIEEDAHGAVLDVQTGKGTLAIAAARKSEVSHVVAVDENPKVLEEARKNAVSAGVSEKIFFQTSDLFQKVEGKFDYIIFNALLLRTNIPARIGWTLLDPEATYLRYKDETIRRFLREAKNQLKPKGQILLPLSFNKAVTLDKGVTLKEIERDYEAEVLEKEYVWLEEILCLSLKPRVQPEKITESRGNE